MKRIYLLLVATFILLLSACEAKTESLSQKKVYVDGVLFAKGRPCPEVLFMCLPESSDKNWQEQQQNKNNSIDFFELTPAVTSQYNKTVAKWNKIYEEKSMEPYVIDEKDELWIKEVERKQFLIEMEQQLAKEFPGFWRDVPKPVRYRWIRRAISKAHKLGYNLGKGNEIQIIELCARIGLDFDLDSKWETITKFILLPKGVLRGYGAHAVTYIDFTVFEKDNTRTGTKITDWLLRTPLQYLPYPKRKVPKLND